MERTEFGGQRPSVAAARALALVLAVVWPAAALGLPDDAPQGVTPEELEALRESLGADAAATPQEPAAPPGLLSGIGGVVQGVDLDIAFILDVSAAYFSEDAPLQTGGHDPTKTGFNFQQLEMSIGAAVDPFFRFDANIVFGQFGVEVEEAVVTTLALPVGLQVRAGQFLTRIGRINPTHPHSWSFVDQPLVIGRMFGSEGSRGLGGELSWLSPLPWYLELVASLTEAGGECCARSFYGGDDPGVDGIEDLLTTIALKQFFPFDDDWSLAWGLSAQLGPNPTGQDNRTEIYASDLYLRWRPAGAASRRAVSLTVEGLFRTRQVPDDVLQDWGGYAQLVWRIDPEWEVGGRAEYGSGVEEDPLDPTWTEDRARYAVQGTWMPSHFSRIRLQGAADVPEWRDPLWSAFLQLEVVVGAHGAHTF